MFQNVRKVSENMLQVLILHRKHAMYIFFHPNSGFLGQIVVIWNLFPSKQAFTVI